MSAGEYDFEPIPGLPENLPGGEKILWQGSPEWVNLARRAFHLPKIAVYFCIILAFQYTASLSAGNTLVETAVSSLGMIGLALFAIGILSLIAWLIARTTLYTITSERVVMRFGVAISMSINIPLNRILSASVKQYGKQMGDIPLVLDKSHRVSFVVMYPHVRPWHYARPEPMLRCVNKASDVAEILAQALHQHAGMSKQQTVNTVEQPQAPAGVQPTAA